VLEVENLEVQTAEGHCHRVEERCFAVTNPVGNGGMKMATKGDFLMGIIEELKSSKWGIELDR
jgi:hypothetical protein